MSLSVQSEGAGQHAFANRFIGQMRFTGEPSEARLKEISGTLRTVCWGGVNLEMGQGSRAGDDAFCFPCLVKGWELPSAAAAGLDAAAAAPEPGQPYARQLEALFGCQVTLKPLLASVDEPELLRSVANAMGRQRFVSTVSVSDPPPPEAKPTARPADKKRAFAKLDALIGLDQVKAQVREIVSFAESRGRESLPCLHMVFRGNPGTGKTTVARVIGQIFDVCGVTKKPGTFVETDRSGLVGRYVGHTAHQTVEVINKARGGLLFIDEAYSLGLYASDLGAGPDGRPGRRDFGPEAIDVLAKAMEDYRDELVCVMAGYTKEMDQMLDVNPGLRDRVAFYIDFPDYTAPELTTVFKKLAKDKGYTLSAKAARLLERRFEAIAANPGPNFANGRIARKVLERATLKQARRTTGRRLGADDIEAAFAAGDLAALVLPARRSFPTGFQAAAAAADRP